MTATFRVWLAIAGGTAVGLAWVIGLAGATAGAEPVVPPPPTPVPGTQAAVVTPGAGVQPAYPAPASGLGANAGPRTAQPGPATVPGPAPVPTTVQPPRVPATSVTLTDYFKSNNVGLEPQQAAGFKALNLTLPMPPRWSQVPDPNVPDAFLVIADRNTGALYTPNAQLVVYKLVGTFDPGDAITHGFVDSQMLLGWQQTGQSLADFYGQPSSLIEGTYRSNDQTLNTSRRHVIATSGADRYLVSLSVTTGVEQAVAEAPATNAIVNGFRVNPPAPSVMPPTAPRR